MVDVRFSRARVPDGCGAQGRFDEDPPEVDDTDRNVRPLPWYVAELIGAPPVVVTTLAVVALLGILAAAVALFWWVRP